MNPGIFIPQSNIQDESKWSMTIYNKINIPNIMFGKISSTKENTQCLYNLYTVKNNRRNELMLLEVKIM